MCSLKRAKDANGLKHVKHVLEVLFFTLPDIVASGFLKCPQYFVTSKTAVLGSKS